MLAELKEITAKKREIQFSRMSDPIWIFLNFFGGFFRITDLNPVSIDNYLFKNIPSSVCGQGGPAKKKKYVSGSKPDTCFFVFFDRSSRPPGGWASTLGDPDPVGWVLWCVGLWCDPFNHPPNHHVKPPHRIMQLWCVCGSFNGSSDHIHHNTPNHAHFGAHSTCFGVFQPAIRPLIHPTTPNAPHFGSMGESMKHIKPPRRGIGYGGFRLI